jgi:hypothetical protein
MHQQRIAIKTKRVYITRLAYLSKHFGYKKSFKEITAQDLAGYLDSFRRDQSEDPDQKWVNTHNTIAQSISKFYRWVAYLHLGPLQRRKYSSSRRGE